jgi:hypothetical protein
VTALAWATRPTAKKVVDGRMMGFVSILIFKSVSFQEVDSYTTTAVPCLAPLVVCVEEIYALFCCISPIACSRLLQLS